MLTVRLFLLSLLIAAACPGSVSAEEKSPPPPDRIGTISTAAVTGLASGILGSLVAPWVQWGIELRRNRLSYRRDVIKFAREDAKPGFSSENFLKTYSYSILKDDFLPETRLRLSETVPPPDTGFTEWQEGMRMAVISEIARIERQWGLV